MLDSAPISMRWVLLTLLTLLAVFAALAAALRTKPSGRAELGLTTCILWNVLLGCPIYALGLTNRLTALSLGTSSALFFVVVLVAASWGGPSPRELLVAFVQLAVLPFEALAVALRARSVVVLTLTLTAFLIVCTPRSASYFTPSWRQWDSLCVPRDNHRFYDPKSRLFAGESPGRPAEGETGIRASAKMIQLWFVIFTDRRLSSRSPTASSRPELMYALTYVIARRYTRDSLSSMGWATVDDADADGLVPPREHVHRPPRRALHPGRHALRDPSTYFGSWTPGSRPRASRWPSARSSSRSPGGGHRGHRLGAPPTPLRLPASKPGHDAGPGVPHPRDGRQRVLRRNWVHYRNPLWPDFQYDNDRYHIHLPYLAFQPNALDPEHSNQGSLGRAGERAVLRTPPWGRRGNSTATTGSPPRGSSSPSAPRRSSSSSGFPRRHAFGRLFRVARWTCPDAPNALLVVLPVVVQVYHTSPALWGSRYHIANVAARSPASSPSGVGGRGGGRSARGWRRRPASRASSSSSG